jgi:hypothetical protein
MIGLLSSTEIYYSPCQTTFSDSPIRDKKPFEL